jgi:hypothetical protein
MKSASSDHYMYVEHKKLTLSQLDLFFVKKIIFSYSIQSNIVSYVKMNSLSWVIYSGTFNLFSEVNKYI